MTALVHYRCPAATAQPIECGGGRPVLGWPRDERVTGDLKQVTCGPCRQVALVCNVLADLNGGQPGDYRATARARLGLQP